VRRPVKIACSSATFAGTIARGELTQLEWLDLCANELEVDGIVFDAVQFPRTDGDYLAQLKKFAVDLGLTVAGLSADDVFGNEGGRWLDIALTLGAPLVVARAHRASDDPAGWGDFVADVKVRSREAKRDNVTLAIRNTLATLCETAADLERLAKEVDSAWVRFALDTAVFTAVDDTRMLLPDAAIAWHTVADVEHFATRADVAAEALVRALARFRGFIVLDSAHEQTARNDSYHRALERFAALRASALVAGAFER